MALSGLEVLGSFFTGVQEQAQKYDEDLAKRIQDLTDKGPSDITKSKYKADYAEYLEDKKKLAAITAAGIDSDRGQMLAGGYKSMKDYFDTRDKDPDLYHEMFTLGEEPKYTPADYGLTNVRDDGSQITTAGQIFDQFFRPDVHKARLAEQIPTAIAETSTTYRRTVDAEGNQLNPRDLEDIETSRAAVKARAVALQSAGEHEKREQKLTVITFNKDDNTWTEHTLSKNATFKETGDKAFELGKGNDANAGIYAGYKVISSRPWQDPTQAKNDTIIDYTQELWVKDGLILADQDSFDREGAKRITIATKIIKTGNPEHKVKLADGETLTGWRYLQQDPIEPDAITKPTTLDYIKQNDNGSWTKFTLALHPEGLTGETAKTLGGAYEGYQVVTEQPWQNPTRAKNDTTQTYTQELFTLDGDFVEKGTEGAEPVSVKSIIIKTGKKTDVVHTSDGSELTGWRYLQRDPIEVTADEKTTRGQEWDEDVTFIMEDHALLPTRYNNIMRIMGYVNEDETVMKLTPHIALAIAQRADSIKVNVFNGLMVDEYAEQFGMADTLEDIAIEREMGYRPILPGQAKLFTQYRLEGLEYYDDLKQKDYYRIYYQGQLEYFVTTYKTTLSTAASVMDRILPLAMINQDGHPWWLNVKDFIGRGIKTFDETTVIWVDPKTNEEFTVEHVINQVGKEKMKPENKDKTWGKVTDDILKDFRMAKLGVACDAGDEASCTVLKELQEK